MSVSAGRSRHGGATVRVVVRRGVLAVLGVALASYGVYSAISAVRICWEPETRVRLECEIGHRDHSCPASWAIDHHTVHGAASDPYSGHRYSRFLDHAPNAVLTMHVSGNQATMTPAASSMFAFLGFPVFGLGMMLAPFWDKIPPRRRNAKHLKT